MSNGLDIDDNPTSERIYVQADEVRAADDFPVLKKGTIVNGGSKVYDLKTVRTDQTIRAMIASKNSFIVSANLAIDCGPSWYDVSAANIRVG